MLLPLLAEDTVATSSDLEQFFTNRKITPTKLIVHTTVYKQKMTLYNNALNLYEYYINQLLFEQASEINKIVNNVNGIVNNLQTPSN